MFLDFKKQAEKALKTALQKAGYEADNLEIELSEHADLASKIAFRLEKKSPAMLAEQICYAFPKKIGKLISRVEAKGPYINFFVSDEFLERAMEKILRERDEYGNLRYKGKVIIEHTSANPDGPLHVGHIRNAVIGDTLARILKKAGYSVETQYYVNDMGRQIAVVVWGFGKLQVNLDRLKVTRSSDGDHAIAEIYINANKLLEEMPAGERGIAEGHIAGILREYEAHSPYTVKMFKDVVELCLSGIKETLKELGIVHGEFIWESEFTSPKELGGRGNITTDIITRARKLPYAFQDPKTNWLMLDLSKEFGIEKELSLVRSDGVPLYAARDLAYHRWKAEKCDGQHDRIIDVLGADHKLHAQQLKAVMPDLGIRPPEVIIFEFVSLPTGSMSTRAGKYISADELMDKVEAEALKEVEKRREYEEKFKRDVAKAVSVGAIRYDIIKVSPEKSMTFDWKDALDFEKQSAPFIQYSHARACSILRKAGEKIGKFDASLLKETGEITLIKKLSQFSMFIDTAAKELKPHILAIYAREIAEAFNAFYRDCPVLEAAPNIRKARLALVDCTRIVLKNVLDVLGIVAPEMM